MKDLPKTYDGHRLGEIVVKDHGICKIVDVDGYAGYTMETIMPKEVFIEAYNKYIKDEAVEPERPQGEYETECNVLISLEQIVRKSEGWEDSAIEAVHNAIQTAIKCMKGGAK